jgi:hypothetical protein
MRNVSKTYTPLSRQTINTCYVIQNLIVRIKKCMLMFVLLRYYIFNYRKKNCYIFHLICLLHNIKWSDKIMYAIKVLVNRLLRCNIFLFFPLKYPGINVAIIYWRNTLSLMYKIHVWCWCVSWAVVSYCIPLNSTYYSKVSDNSMCLCVSIFIHAHNIYADKYCIYSAV